MRVSPTWGIRSAPATKSRLTLPTTTIGFCIREPLRSVYWVILFGHHGRDGDRSQSQQEEEKHGGNQFAGGGRSMGKLFPDENAPNGRNHSSALADGVRNSRTHNLRMRGDKIKYRPRTPDDAARNSPEMPHWLGFGILRHAHRGSAGERLFHKEIVHRNGAKRGPQSKEEGDRIRTQCVCSGHSLGDQR